MREEAGPRGERSHASKARAHQRLLREGGVGAAATNRWCPTRDAETEALLSARLMPRPGESTRLDLTCRQDAGVVTEVKRSDAQRRAGRVASPEPWRVSVRAGREHVSKDEQCAVHSSPTTAPAQRRGA